jgi:hypothetical protein
MNDKTITINLVGGLGNQLFELFAGINLALTSQCKLDVNLSTLKTIGENHENTIQTIDFHELAQKFNYVEKEESRYLYRLQGKLSRLFPNQQIKFSRFTRRYFSPVSGFDPSLLNLSPPMSLSGYFQCWTNFNEVVEKLGDRFELTVNKPTDWYLDMKQVSNAVRPVMVHLRRGDYELLRNSFGLLSSDYYLRAISNLRPELANREIWIFSDSPNEAEKLRSLIVNRNVRVVKAPVESTDFESLKLLSLGSAIITANSTFSWWAAMLSNETCQRIVPDKWFKNITDPAELIPKDWLRVKTIWEK